MPTTDEWAAFSSGSYYGWMRAPDGQWEDLIGRVEVECVANADGALDVTISSVEFGTWPGRMRLEDMVVEGPTGQRDSFFRCTFDEKGTADEVQGSFVGGIFEPPNELLFELRLSSYWRRRRPA